MEEQSMTRKMGPAAIRRHRTQERQKHKELMAEQREGWRKRRQRYSELSKTDSNHSHSNSLEHDSSADSPVEDNVPTPGSSVSPDVEFNISISDLTLERFARRSIDMEERLGDKFGIIHGWSLKTTLPLATEIIAPPIQPISPRTNRFSTVIDSIGIDISPDNAATSMSTPTESEEESAEDYSSDSDYEYSPVEIATPVTFSVPINKPNVISVVELRSQRPLARSSTSMSSTPSPRTSISTYNSQQAPHSKSDDIRGFLPYESEPYGVFAPTSSSLISITSTASSSSATSGDAPSIFDRTSSNGDAKRKSSIPMFSKFTHARMNSIKKLIKPQSVSGETPAVPTIPSMHPSQPLQMNRSVPASPSTPSPIYLNKISGECETFDGPSRRPVTELVDQLKRNSPTVRPQTSHQPRANLTKASHAPTKVSTVDVDDTHRNGPQIKRKKSFSSLRRRSGSLGQVLKLSNDKNKSPILDGNPPPVPIINADDYAALGYGPTPKPPKSSRTSGLLMQSPFPSNSQFQTSVGLGLRL